MKKIQVSKVITKNVTKCSECPYFISHPHEPSCELLKKSGDSYYNIVQSRDKIDSRCPYLNN